MMAHPNITVKPKKYVRLFTTVFSLSLKSLYVDAEKNEIYMMNLTMKFICSHRNENIHVIETFTLLLSLHYYLKLSLKSLDLYR